MMYADYGYYVSEFGGSIVPESDWQARATKASRYIDQITLMRAAEMPDHDGVKLATCAVAEIQYKYAQQDKRTVSSAGVSSESVGNHSVSYTAVTEETLAVKNAEMQQAASLYLFPTGLLYKGVSYADQCRRDYLPSIN